MIDFTIKKQTSKVTRDQIIDYLDKKFWEEKEYECMPENEYGYEYVPREALGKIVDGLIPMVKNMIKQKNNSSPKPDQATEEEIKRILMNNFTRGDIKTATQQLDELFKEKYTQEWLVNNEKYTQEWLVNNINKQSLGGIDLKQYVTNLLYAAYDRGIQKLEVSLFDKWAEEMINLLDRYYFVANAYSEFLAKVRDGIQERIDLIQSELDNL